jgi:regulator of protease activity HflC (stomatin/prohibitin superfamily)
MAQSAGREGYGMSTDTAPPAIAPREQVHEFQAAGAVGRRARSLGVLALIGTVVLVALGIRLAVHGSAPAPLRAVVWAAVFVLVAAGVQALRGLIQVRPGEAVVVQLFGSYRGTVRKPGLSWVHPWSVRRRVSVKIRTYETPVMRVNDSDGNPVEIALVAVWEVADTARAVFAVDDVAEFVAVQTEVAARQTATSYPYDDHGTGKPCLRASTAEITGWLCADMAERVAAAGVHILETRITQLGYAPEIAHAMLRRQQADAVVAARQKIVDGAVGMVEAALSRLAIDGIIEFDEERKAAMVSNMLVVLCSDQATQPVVNTGTLYQ